MMMNRHLQKLLEDSEKRCDALREEHAKERQNWLELVGSTRGKGKHGDEVELQRLCESQFKAYN